MSEGSARPSGSLTGRVIPAPMKRPPIRDTFDLLRYGTPHMFSYGEKREWQKANAENFERSIADQQTADRSNVLTILGHLWLARVDLNGQVHDLGLAGARMVTTAGVNYIVDSFQGLVEPENMRYHGVGTGGGAEAIGNTGLTTELTTAYQTSSTRPTGTLSELSGSANVFETAATITVSASVALTEHGIFSTAAANTGVLLDKTLFAVVNLAAGESLQATFDFTINPGG